MAFWDIQEYWCKFSQTHAMNYDERGGLPCPFWKPKKNALILERKALIMKCLYQRVLLPLPSIPPPPNIHTHPHTHAVSKMLHLKYSTVFWICLCLINCSTICAMASHMCYIRHIQDSCIFSTVFSSICLHS